MQLSTFFLDAHIYTAMHLMYAFRVQGYANTMDNRRDICNMRDRNGMSSCVCVCVRMHVGARNAASISRNCHKIYGMYCYYYYMEYVIRS